MSHDTAGLEFRARAPRALVYRNTYNEPPLGRFGSFRAARDRAFCAAAPARRSRALLQCMIHTRVASTMVHAKLTQLHHSSQYGGGIA